MEAVAASSEHARLFEKQNEVADAAQRVHETIRNWPVESSKKLSKRADNLGIRIEELRRDEFQVALVGEYSSGKSTLINALLGEEVLGTAHQAKTAVVTYVRHKNTFEKIRGEIGAAGVKRPEGEGAFAIVTFEDTEHTGGQRSIDEERKAFKKWLSTNVETNTARVVRNKISSQRSEAGSEALAELARLLLRDGGPPDDKYALNEVRRTTIKQFGNEITEDERSALEDFLERFEACNVPEIVEEGSVVVEDPEEYASKREEDSDVRRVLSDFAERIDVFVGSPLLKRGGVLVDLPGANSGDEADKQVTIDYIEDEDVDAVLLMHDFRKSSGRTTTMKEIVEVIESKRSSVKERVFLVVNYLDENWSRDSSFDEFEKTYNAHYSDVIEPQNVFFTSALLSLHFSLQDIDPVGTRANGETHLEGKALEEKVQEMASSYIADREDSDKGAFIEVFADYVRNFSSLRHDDSFSLTDLEDHKIFEQAIEHKPSIVYEVSRLKGLQNERSYLRKHHTGIHEMYENLMEYLYKRQVQEKYDAVAEDAERAIEEALNSLEKEGQRLGNFERTPEEFGREQRYKLKKKFEEASKHLDDYLRRLSSEVEEKFESSGKNEIIGDNDDPGLVAANVVDNVNFDALQAGMNSSEAASREERRLLEKFNVEEAAYSKVKLGLFAEEVLCKVVDMTLRIAWGYLYRIIKRYIKRQYTFTEKLLADDSIPLSDASDADPVWGQSLRTALCESGIMTDRMYEREINEGLINKIISEEVKGAQAHLDRHFPAMSGKRDSVYRAYVESLEDDEDASDMETLVRAEGLDEPAARKVAKAALSRMVEGFLDDFHPSERIPFRKRIVEDTDDTLYSGLRELLSPEGDLMEERHEALLSDRAQEFKRKEENHKAHYETLADTSERLLDSARNLKRTLHEVDRGLWYTSAEMEEAWEKATERFGTSNGSGDGQAEAGADTVAVEATT